MLNLDLLTMLNNKENTVQFWVKSTTLQPLVSPLSSFASQEKRKKPPQATNFKFFPLFILSLFFISFFLCLILSFVLFLNSERYSMKRFS